MTLHKEISVVPEIIYSMEEARQKHIRMAAEILPSFISAVYTPHIINIIKICAQNSADSEQINEKQYCKRLFHFPAFLNGRIHFPSNFRENRIKPFHQIMHL